MNSELSVDYARRIFYLLVGLLVAAAITCLVVFGMVLPAKHRQERIEHNSQEISDAIACDVLGQC